MVTTITSANEIKREQQHQESQTIPQKPVDAVKVSQIAEPVQIIPPVQQVQQPPQPMLWANLLKPAGQRTQATHVPQQTQTHTQTALETAKKMNPPRDLQMGASQMGQQTVARPKSKSPPPTSVPGVLSYSAASAQGLPTPTSAHALPASKKMAQRPATVANKKFEPIDEWFIKMGG